MKILRSLSVVIVGASVLGAACLSGCSPSVNSVSGATPSVNAASAQATIVKTGQQLYDFSCPTIQSGALDPVAATLNARMNDAYGRLKLACNVGVIKTPGQFAADFVIAEPLIQQYLGKVKIKF